MLGTNLVIVDADAMVALVNEADVNHEKSLQIFDYLASNSFGTITPYPIVLEAANALSRDTKINRPDLASRLLENYSQPGTRPKLDEDIAELVAESFSGNTSRKNTPFDHYIWALAKRNNIKYVFSFDSFYKKQGLIPAEELLKK